MGRLFEDKAFLKRLVNLTLPLAFQALMLALVAASDAVMLGRVEQNSMAAVSLATQIQFIQNMMLCAVTGSIAILGAQYWGKGDKQTIHKIFGMSLRIAFVISLFVCVLCVGFSRQLMMIFASDSELIRIGAGYLRIAGWSYLLTGFSQCFLGMMRVTDHADRCAFISSGAVVINIILNAIFIFGFLGIPAMGANGAALATLLARIIELVWAVISSYQKDFIHPSLGDLIVRDKLLARDYIRCGMPLAGAAMFWGVGFTSYTAIMGHMGTDAAAANSVAAVVRDLMCCLCDGISAAGGIIVGNEGQALWWENIPFICVYRSVFNSCDFACHTTCHKLYDFNTSCKALSCWHDGDYGILHDRSCYQYSNYKWCVCLRRRYPF